MNIPKLLPDVRKSSLPRLFGKKISDKITIRNMTKKIGEMQNAVDGLVNKLDADTDDYTGNPYKTYKAMVAALSDKYRGVADWGSMTAKNVVDVRAAFAIGQGVKPVPRKGVTKFEREMKFIREFMEYNNLDEEVPQDWAKESEIEGKVLLRLVPEKADKQIRAIHIPWSKYNYEVTTDPMDFDDYTKVQYSTTEDEGGDVTLLPPEFVYRRFGGRSYLVNESPSKAAMVLRAFEDLDKCMVDWRKINHLFSAPTPVIECENSREAKQITADLTKINWRIGKLLITSAKLVMIGWEGEGFTTLKEEMIGLIKNISGATGVPVHFLGFPDLLSNRATAENLMELIALSTSRERHIWIGAFEELFQKAVIMNNETLEGMAGLDPMAITAEIPFVSSAKLKELNDVWLPIYVANGMSLESFLALIPGIDDIEKEAKKINAQKEIISNDPVPKSGNTGDGE